MGALVMVLLLQYKRRPAAFFRGRSWVLLGRGLFPVCISMCAVAPVEHLAGLVSCGVSEGSQEGAEAPVPSVGHYPCGQQPTGACAGWGACPGRSSAFVTYRGGRRVCWA